MNNKTLAGIAVVVVVVIVVAAAAVMMNNNNNNDQPATTGNTYYPNGASGSAQTLVNSEAPNSLFTYSGHNFVCWNTSADGLGTSYNPGDTLPSTSGMSLYAIWTTGSYGIDYYSVGSTDDIEYTLNGSTLGRSSGVNAGTNTITVTSASYTLSLSGNTFTYTNSHGYTIAITVTLSENVSGVSYSMVNGVATVTFTATGDIGISISAARA
ncbi:MAG: InlB B-repeat-containing protein [Thermoplasmata archaeon]|nr:InlB B-repeat-containing protein [Thermoplasmata archaeon]